MAGRLVPGALFAAVVVLKLALARSLPGPWLFSDATIYARQAGAIARQGWDALGGAAQEYTILYPLFIAPAFALGSRGEAHQAALAINAVVSTSALLPVYWIARRMLPAPLAAALAAMIAFLPSVFVYALALSSENLFLPLFWWGTFLFLRLAQEDGLPDALAAGLTLGALPAVKLTGFAILAAAALLAVGMALFHRVGGARAAVFLVALVVPQLAWVLLRSLLGTPERGLFGFGPGVGESLMTGLGRVQEAGWRPVAAFFFGETTYFLVGAYVAWVAFSAYLVTQYRTWRSRSAEGFLLLWTFLAAACLSLVTVLLLFPIAQSLTDPIQRARPIYGRFIEVLFPAFFILGTRGMLDFAWEGGSGGGRPGDHLGRQAALLAVVVLFTAVSLYPLTGYAVSGRFRDYAFGATGDAWAAAASLAILLLACLAGGAYLLGRSARRRWGALAVTAGAVLAMHALVSAVSVAGVVRGARLGDATSFRIGHWLERRASPRTRIVYDAALGAGDAYFAYRFWSDADWRVVDSAHLLESGADYIVSRASLPLPVATQEANGVKLYRQGAG